MVAAQKLGRFSKAPTALQDLLVQPVLKSVFSKLQGRDGAQLREVAELVMMACPADPRLTAELVRKGMPGKLQAAWRRMRSANLAKRRLQLAIHCLEGHAGVPPDEVSPTFPTCIV